MTILQEEASRILGIAGDSGNQTQRAARAAFIEERFDFPHVLRGLWQDWNDLDAILHYDDLNLRALLEKYKYLVDCKSPK